MKLSPKQIEVIKLMQLGVSLHCRINKIYGSTFQVIYMSRTYVIEGMDGLDINIHHSTFRGLVQRKLISKNRYYNLTKKGRTINLD